MNERTNEKHVLQKDQRKKTDAGLPYKSCCIHLKSRLFTEKLWLIVNFDLLDLLI